MNSAYHYPPELLTLLVDTIPRLCRSKKDVLVFFRGSGTPNELLQDLVSRVEKDKDSVTKFEMARTILTRLNEKGDTTLRARRELIKRVVEFEDFSLCWPNDILEAKGLVAEIRRIVNIKDSFTRIDLEREEERRKRIAIQQEKIQREQQRRETLSSIRSKLLSLFNESNPLRRGKALEGVLNRLFQVNEILVREAFTLQGDQGDGIIEQIDGIIELDGEIYLVEMKWWATPLGVGDVAQHLVRVFARGHARGIFISTSGYTPAAISSCKEALQRSVVVLSTLQELILLLEKEGDLKTFLKTKINTSIIDKNPFHEILS